MEIRPNYFPILLCFLISLISFEKVFSLTTDTIASLRSNPLGISSGQKLNRVDLGIDHIAPNSRIMAYIDIDNDK
jgi:hypothetical protein